MLGFPLPYANELIYSVIARHAVHHGIVDHRQLVTDVFGDRAATATVDLPNRLNAIAAHYSSVRGKYSSMDLAYSHTTFPLYAPFVSESRRKQCLRWLKRSQKGAVHLALGVAAGRVQSFRRLRYCPACVEEQLDLHGEAYWHREWFVSGTTCCLRHKHPYVDVHRLPETGKHEFVPLVPAKPRSLIASMRFEYESLLVACHTKMLLNLGPLASPSFAQWTAFYVDLSLRSGCRKGAHIDYGAIRERVAEKWSAEWLSYAGLRIPNDESSWLKSLFRKHRKAFSFLQHIVAIEALNNGEWSFNQVIEQARALPETGPARKRTNSVTQQAPLAVLEAKKERWEHLLFEHGVRCSRRLPVGRRLYAWLYRHDRSWLVATNMHHRAPTRLRKLRVEWPQRDREVTRKLINRYRQCFLDRTGPRRTRSYLLNLLENRTTIEKNLHRLPHCKSFLSRYAETVAEYQVRRVNVISGQLKEAGVAVTGWRLYRLAGLSPQRITKKAAQQIELLVERTNGALSKI